MQKSLLWISIAACVVALAAGCKKETFEHADARGRAAVERGDYATAASAFRNATRAKATSREAFYLLGQAELARGNHRKAAEAFIKAAALTTDNSVDALEGLARARTLQKRYDEAESVYDRAMQIAGRTPRLLAAQAGVAIRRSRYEPAMKLLKDALVQNPDDPTALYNMAYIQRTAFSDTPAAVRYYQLFLQVAPETDAQARTNALKALEEMKDVAPSTISQRAETILMNSLQASNKKEAVQLAEQAVNEDPWSADALWNLASRLAEDGQEAARTTRAYTHFAGMFPNDPRRAQIPTKYRITSGGGGHTASTALAQARAAAAAGRWKDAVPLFQRAADADSANLTIWMELCNAARKAPDLNTAEKAARKALALKKDHPEAMYYLGTILVQRGQKKQGFEYVRKYLNTLPASNPRKKQIQDWLKKQGG